MIEILERKDALKRHPFLNFSLVEDYDATYSPDLYSVGDTIIDDNNCDVTLDEIECEKLNSEASQLYQQRRDEPTSAKWKWIRSEILHANENLSFEKAVAELSSGLIKSGFSQWMFLMQAKGCWLSQHNDVNAKVTKWLNSQGIDLGFSGAFIASGTKLASLLQNLFSLARYNASLPEIFVAPMGATFSGVLCKYGNIHCSFYDRSEYDVFLNEAIEHDLFLSTICPRPNSSNPIKGRRIRL